jgi:chromosome partitioning protein
LVDEHPSHDVILPVPGLRHLSVLPATQDLVGAELQLVERPFRESALRRVLEPLEAKYDYIVVDCPPSLGLLTLNVLAAVQQLIIPIQCEYYGLEGISQLLNTVRLVQQNINPGLAIGGVLLTMYDSRLNLCRQVAEDATEYFGAKVFGTPIPRNVRLAEAPSFGKPILLYDVQSVGAKSYLAVAQELLRRVEGTEVTIEPAQVAAAAAHAAAAQASTLNTEPEEPTAETEESPEIAHEELPSEPAHAPPLPALTESSAVSEELQTTSESEPEVVSATNGSSPFSSREDELSAEGVTSPEPTSREAETVTLADPSSTEADPTAPSVAAEASASTPEADQPGPEGASAGDAVEASPEHHGPASVTASVEGADGSPSNDHHHSTESRPEVTT